MTTWYCEKCPKNDYEDCGEWQEGTKIFSEVKKIHENHTGWKIGECPRTTLTTSTTTQNGQKEQIYKVKGRIGYFFVESVILDGEPCFVFNHEKEECLAYIKEIEHEHDVVKPLKREMCGYIPYQYTTEEFEELADNKIPTGKMLDEIFEMVDWFISAPLQTKYLITVDIFLSYCQEHIHTLHFPYAVGETESGKSSILHLVKRLGYRCLYGEGINKANIYNFLGTDEEAAGTIAEDEAQDLEDDKSKLNMYKNSYAKGSVQPVIMGWDGKNKHQVFYKIFGQKWFAGEKIPENKGFRERIAVIYMVSGETKGNIKKPTPEEEKKLHKLRNKLLVWKLQNINNPIPQLECDLKQRDKELWADFLAITAGTKYHETCKEIVKQHAQQRQEGIWNSLEARLFELVIRDMTSDHRIKFEDLWTHIINNSVVTGEVNRNTLFTDEYGRLTKNKVSKILREKFLGIKQPQYQKGLDGNNHLITYYKFDKDTCITLAKKYHIDIPHDHSLFSSGQGSQSGKPESSIGGEADD